MPRDPLVLICHCYQIFQPNIAQGCTSISAYITDIAITKLYTTVLPKPSIPKASGLAISDEQIDKIAQQAADIASEKAMNIRYDKLDAAADTIMHRMYNLVHGAIWAAIPKWVYIVFATSILAAVG